MKLSKRTRNGIIRYLHIQGDAIKRAEQARLAAIDYRKSLTADFAKADFKVGQRVRAGVDGAVGFPSVEGFTVIGADHQPRLLLRWKGKRFLADPEQAKIVSSREHPNPRALEYSSTGPLSGNARLTKAQARTLKAKFNRGYHSDTAEDNLSPTSAKLPPFNKKNVGKVGDGMLVRAMADLAKPKTKLTKAKLQKMLVIVKRVAKMVEKATGNRRYSAVILINQINKRIKEVSRGR